MAQRIAARQHDTIKEAVADILRHVSWGDFLRRRPPEKVAPINEEVLKGMVAELTKTIIAVQKEH